MVINKYDMVHIDAMNGYEFEHFIANLLHILGYQRVEITPGSGDQGVDVLAEKDGVRYAVQCKCYSSDLGNSPVQEVNTGKAIYHCHVGIVVTNRFFTQGAKEAAKATGVLLWDRSKLESLVAQVNGGVNIDLSSQQNENAITLWNGSSLLKRGEIALKDREWKKASQFFDRVLNSEPENAEAYLGLVMAELGMPDQEAFEWAYINRSDLLNENRNLIHTKEFARSELSAWFTNLDIQRKETELRLEAQQEEQRQKRITELLSPRKKLSKVAGLLAAGNNFIVGVQVDGTVVAVGNNEYGQCDVSEWNGIVAVAAGDHHTVGLKDDGTVVTTGDNKYGQCNVTEWDGIVAVAAGGGRTIGLKNNGTVLVIGDYDYDCELNDLRDDVTSWTDIVAVTAGEIYTMGLKADGTILGDEFGLADTVAVSSGIGHAVGVKNDGTVIATGDNSNGECNVSGWTGIVATAVGSCHTVGLKSDSTVVAVGFNKYGQCNVKDWKNIVAVAAKFHYTVGLKDDGTVVATGLNSDGLSYLWNGLICMRLLTLDGKCNACGEKVRAAREKVGLSQEQLAARIQLRGHSLTQKAISRIENGSRVVPDFEIPLLAEALNVNPLWLLGMEKDT